MKQILFLVIVAMITSCQSPMNGEVKLHAWQQRYPDESLEIWIDGINKGKLPAVKKALHCGDPGLDSTLVIVLKHGEHGLKVTGPNGRVVAEGTMTVKGDNLELRGKSGGMDARQNMDCISLEVL